MSKSSSKYVQSIQVGGRLRVAICLTSLYKLIFTSPITMNQVKILFKTFWKIDLQNTLDFWHKLYEWHWIKIFATIWGFATIFISPIFGINMVIYNQNRHIRSVNSKKGIFFLTNDVFRTILNYMESAVIISGTFALNQILVVEEFRYFFGPLPAYLCWYLTFNRNSPLVAMSLFLDSIAIFRVSNRIILNYFEFF